MNINHEVQVAAPRIRNYIFQTPLIFSPRLSKDLGCELFFKLENLQYTGSFKVRGAMNKLLSLTPQQQERGIVAASTGNHGFAVAYSLYTLNLKGIVFLPETAASDRVSAIQNYGIEAQSQGKNSAETEVYAREYAAKSEMIYLSPYNDLQVIAGQGTIGLELIAQLDNIDSVFVAVGGGGLVSGIGGFLQAHSPTTTIIGCQPDNSAVMAKSVNAGHLVEEPILQTLSDSTAGNIEPGAITFDLCREIVNEFVLVTEAEIKNAMLRFMELHHMLIEGAAGVPLAAMIQQKEKFQGKKVVVVLCGSNISLETLRKILV